MDIAAFPHIVFRTPCSPLDITLIEQLFTTSIFNEALFLASPDLYVEKIKTEQKGIKYGQKLIMSLFKYASRAMTRSTPFGLFAGCSMATVGEHMNVIIQNQPNYQRCTRLDMHYICALVQNLENNKAIRRQLLYYPNDSLYEFGGRLRYVEYHYHKTNRVHNLSGIDASEYVQRILIVARQGVSIDQLAQMVTDDEVSLDEAIEFIHELIDNQILKSELEVGVTGVNLIDELINRLKQIASIDELKQTLQNIRCLLSKIDHSSIGTTIPVYEEIITEIKKMGVEYEPRFLFQTDLYKPAKQAVISQTILQNIVDGLNFLNKITITSQVTDLSKFKEAFTTRYEEQEILLMEAMDKELGIGYPVGQNDGDQSLLVDGITVPTIYNINSKTLDEWSILLLKKYVIALQEKKTCIVLTDKDVKGGKSNWGNFPPTFSCVCELINDHDIYMNQAGGNSAANLLGRFCHLNKDIETHVKTITMHEQKANPDAIYAEIVHMPESRGNVLFRPILREYEIPYLCRVGVDNDHIIPLSDLTISIRNKRLVLRSKKLNKEIIPRLSTAHNYRYNNAMPVYRFLCDMQHAVGRSGIMFSWGAIAEIFDYLPRVVYKNCILSYAHWVIKNETIQVWAKITDDVIINSITQYRRTQNIPEKVVIPDADNKLFIDFTNLLSVHIFLDIGKKRNGIVIEEFLFDEKQAVVKDEEGNVFCNEFIVSFYKTTEETTKK
jgi:hypothetical protein